VWRGGRSPCPAGWTWAQAGRSEVLWQRRGKAAKPADLQTSLARLLHTGPGYLGVGGLASGIAKAGPALTHPDPLTGRCLTPDRMRVIRYLILWLARRFQGLGGLFYRFSDLFNGLLPALFSPPELTRLLTKHYARLYSDGFVRQAQDLIDYLERWEAEVLGRYQITSGRMLVLGSGLGRESIAIARKGVSVVGVETNPTAVRIAQQMAGTVGVPARFLQADFLQLPDSSESFDFVLLSQLMYSAIPGRSQRQTWVANLRRVLKPNGLVILSFLPAQAAVPRLKTICRRLNGILVRLPGANMAYQPGDECDAEHFLHRFQDEEEVRTELIGAGGLIQELDWVRGFAVLTYLPCMPREA